MVLRINYPYFAKLFKFFVVKLKLLRRSSDSLLLGMTNITLVLRFVTSNKFYYVQAVKVVNLKEVIVVEASSFATQLQIFFHFSISNFLVLSPYK